MLPPPAPVVSDVSSQLQMALLQVLQGLGSSGGVAPIPDVSVIDRSVKTQKQKVILPPLENSFITSLWYRRSTRHQVTGCHIVRRQEMSLKTGYSKAHDRYELDKEKYRFFAIEGQGVMAKVFVQVKIIAKRNKERRIFLCKFG